MKKLFSLALLSMFMALPSKAELKFVEGVKFVAEPAAPTPEGFPPQGYEWDLLIDSVWTRSGETSGPQRIFTGPYGKKMHTRLVPVIHADPPWPFTDPILETGSIRGPLISEPSIKFSIYPDFDYDNNGTVGISDFGYLLRTPSEFSIQNYGLFGQVFGYRIENGQYIYGAGAR